MKILLQKLGNPLQAPAVPTIIERIAHAQFGMIHSVLKRRLMWNEDSLVLSYFKGDRIDAAGLPLYCVIAEGAGFSNGMPADVIEQQFVTPILNRFKGRAQIGFVGNSSEYASVYQWGMWLDDDIMRRYESQELPLFEDTGFDCFADFQFATRLPMFSYDYELLREKLEASAAAVGVQVQSESACLITLPAVKRSTKLIEPDSVRLEYVLRLLKSWNGQFDGFKRETDSALLERRGASFPNFLHHKATQMRNRTHDLIKAENAFVQMRVMGGNPVQSNTFSLSSDELFAYLGMPHRTILKDSKEIGVFYHRVGNALFLSEATDGKICVYHFPGSEGTYLQYERFCRELGA